jgi:Zn-dependent alcohol dehydrogenase
VRIRGAVLEAFARRLAVQEVELDGPERGGPLADGATTGIGAALYIARVEPGSICAVFGAGSRRPLRGGPLPGATDTLVGSAEPPPSADGP